MPINSRSKGRNGEYEAAKWLTKVLGLDYTPERNLEQTRDGGYDLYAPPFMVEVKRCERLELVKWWRQVSTAASLYIHVIPIVLYRPNRQKWRMLISATNIGLDKGFVTLENGEAKKWLRMQYQAYQDGLESGLS